MSRWFPSQHNNNNSLQLQQLRRELQACQDRLRVETDRTAQLVTQVEQQGRFIRQLQQQLHDKNEQIQGLIFDKWQLQKQLHSNNKINPSQLKSGSSKTATNDAPREASLAATNHQTRNTSFHKPIQRSFDNKFQTKPHISSSVASISQTLASIAHDVPENNKETQSNNNNNNMASMASMAETLATVRAKQDTVTTAAIKAAVASTSQNEDDPKTGKRTATKTDDGGNAKKQRTTKPPTTTMASMAETLRMANSQSHWI